MKVRLSIVAGLLAGVAVVALAFGGIVALAPEPAPLPSAAPSIAVASVGPSTGPSALVSASPGASASASAGASGATGAFHIGEPAPALVVPQVGGGTIDLTNLKGKPVWINFMATWCPPCQDEFPLMNGLATRYAGNGLVVIAIDVREEEGAVATFGEQLGATFPLGLDSDGAAANTWGAIALPVHFWIDAQGIVRDGALGGIGPDIMVAGLKKILPGVDVTP
jgi:cytochrome c biogenesis protein CcmG/thiol:disulfide interchange protein DsbE